MFKSPLLLFTLFCVLSTYTLKAQTLSTYYTFSSPTGTYTPITGGTVLGTASSDDQIYINPSSPAGATLDNPITGLGFNIGFIFSFNGFSYNRIGISTNGWIALGQSTLTPAVDMSNSLTFPASTGFYEMFNGIDFAVGQAPTLQNRIGALDMDLECTGSSELRIETIGSAPNRTCVIQWAHCRKWTSAPTTIDNYNFQIRLNESSNTIEFVYGAFTDNGVIPNSDPSIGLRMGSDYLDRQLITDWSSTIAGTNVGAKVPLTTVQPTSGLTFLWTPSPSMPLPVKIAGFAATAKKGDVLLSWSTATESNNAGFDIERSIDGKVFENVEFVKGAGNSSAVLNYNQTDYNAFTKAGSNTLYYRLIQKDLDGKKSLSDVVMVASTGKVTSPVEVFPNPFSKSLSLKTVSAHAGSYIVEMANLQGKIVSRTSINLVKGANLVVINDFSSLNPGVYFMKIKDLDNTLIKLVKTN
jgi:hypothetical protein